MAVYIGSLTGTEGVDKHVIREARVKITHAVVEAAKEWEEERKNVMLIASSSAFKGQAASAMADHMLNCVVPVIDNAIEACAQLKEEAERIQTAYNSLDLDANARIIYDEVVNGAAFRVHELTDKLNPTIEHMKSIVAKAARLDCEVVAVDESEILSADREYGEACRDLVDLSKQYDSQLTATINALSQKIGVITDVATSALRNARGRVALHNEGRETALDSLAWRTIQGEFGDGQDRKDALGDLYDEVQSRVNELWSAQGGPKDGVVPPTSLEGMTIDEYRTRWVKTDDIVTAMWSTPMNTLPFGKGATGSVDERMYNSTLNTDDLHLDRLGGGLYINPKEVFEKNPDYYELENYVADPRASRLQWDVTPEQVQSLQSTSYRKASEERAFRIDLVTGVETEIDLTQD